MISRRCGFYRGYRQRQRLRASEHLPLYHWIMACQVVIVRTDGFLQGLGLRTSQPDAKVGAGWAIEVWTSGAQPGVAVLLVHDGFGEVVGPSSGVVVGPEAGVDLGD